MLSESALAITGVDVKVSCIKSDAVLICSRKHRHILTADSDGTFKLSRSIGGPLQKADRCPLVKSVVREVLNSLPNSESAVAPTLFIELLRGRFTWERPQGKHVSIEELNWWRKGAQTVRSLSGSIELTDFKSGGCQIDFAWYRSDCTQSLLSCLGRSGKIKLLPGRAYYSEAGISECKKQVEAAMVD